MERLRHSENASKDERYSAGTVLHVRGAGIALAALQMGRTVERAGSRRRRVAGGGNGGRKVLISSPGRLG